MYYNNTLSIASAFYRTTLSAIALTVCFSNAPLRAVDSSALISIAHQNSPLLKAVRSDADSEQADYHAESLFKSNPVFGIEYRNIPLSSWPSADRHAMSGIHFSVSQQIASPFENSSSRNKKEARARAARFSVSEIRRSITREIKILSAKIAHNLRKEEILQKSLLNLKKTRKLAATLVSVNKLNSAELLRIEADIAELNNRILQNESETHSTITGIEEIAGVSIPYEIFLKDNDIKTIDLQIPPPVSEISFNNHPFLAAARFRLEAARSELSREKSALFPAVTLGAGYTFRQKTAADAVSKSNGEDFISVKASAPLPLFYYDRETHQIDASESDFRAEQARYRGAVNTLESRYRRSRINLLKTSEALQASSHNIVPRYLAAYRASLSSLRAGRSRLIDVLDTYERYLQTMISESSLYMQLEAEQAELAYLLPGRDNTKDNKSSDPAEEKKRESYEK